jgi:uncharacterized protein (UPF0264 family)
MVSVVNQEEARSAMEGGADIVDIKNPSEGALGANLPWITRSIVEEFGKSIETSATLGDMPNLPGTASLAAIGASFLKVDYLKVGMFGAQTEYEALNLAKALIRTFREFKLKNQLVIAGYADYEEQECINPLVLPQIAADVGAWGVLIDIKRKDSEGLFHYFSFDELKKFVNESHSLGLNVGLSGSLGVENIQKIMNLNADIMGIRRGVCRYQNRMYQVDKQLVKSLTGQLQHTTH